MSQSKLINKDFGSIRVFDRESRWTPVAFNITGDMKHSVRNTDHNGWLLCDGRALAIEQYPELYDVIGTSFGNPTQGCFSLPDCRGRVLGGIGHGNGLSVRNLGDSNVL